MARPGGGNMILEGGPFPMRGYERGREFRSELRSRAGEVGGGGKLEKDMRRPDVGQSRSQPTGVHSADMFERRNGLNSPSKSCAVCQWKNGCGCVTGGAVCVGISCHRCAKDVHFWDHRLSVSGPVAAQFVTFPGG